MKNFKTAAVAAAIILFFLSCKEKKSPDTLPRDAFSRNPGGIVMKSSPDVKSGMVAVIPFAERVTLTENSEQGGAAESRTKWYKAQWNGKSGWIQESSVGGAESVTDQIRVSFSEQKSGFTPDFIKAYEASSMQISDTYVYPGGEMEPAKMMFLTGGIMVLNSMIFTENYSNTFFSYEFLNEGKLLRIRFVDSKLKFDEYAEMENSTPSVFKIDKNDRSITYQVKENGFFFLNWGFHKE